MKVEDLVLSIEQMAHLKELGVDVKDTALCWCRYKSDDYSYSWNFCKGEDRDRDSVMEYVPTLTLQEILDMLPESIVEECYKSSLFKLLISKQNISYSNTFNYVINGEYGKSMIGNAYNMLCWCAENGYLNNKNDER